MFRASRSLASRPWEAIQNKMDDWRAGILTAGEARARRIPEAVCNERTTKPAVKRPSENVHLILNGLQWSLMPDDSRAPRPNQERGADSLVRVNLAFDAKTRGQGCPRSFPRHSSIGPARA